MWKVRYKATVSAEIQYQAPRRCRAAPLLIRETGRSGKRVIVVEKPHECFND
jgi:hypothetical protein